MSVASLVLACSACGIDDRPVTSAAPLIGSDAGDGDALPLTQPETCEEPSGCEVDRLEQCAEPQQRCDPNAPSRIQTCSSAGAWNPSTSCPPDTTICVEGSCRICAPNESRCTDDVLEQCSETGSGWVPVETCSGATPACLERSKSCGRCGSGDRQCRVDVVQTCDESGQWQDEETCLGERPACRSDLGVTCGCVESDRRCVDGTPQVCTNGSWLMQAACAGSAPVCLESTGQCAACSPDAERCNAAGRAERCDASGAWEALGSCAGARINCGNCELGDSCNVAGDCSSGACVSGRCAECTPAERDCVGNTPRLCSPEGRWVEQAPCTGELRVCVGATPSCQCPVDLSVCLDATTERRCVDGVMQNRACGSGFACSSTQCEPMAPAAPTGFSDVFPILRERCGGCHGGGGLLPGFAQPNEDAAYAVTQSDDLAELIVRRAGNGEMPPGCSNGGPACVSDEQAALLQAWLDDGALR